MIKTAIVTGATGEIGRAVTKALLQNDFAVCAVYNTGKQKAEEMSKMYEGKPFYTLCADISDAESTEKLYNEANSLLGKIGTSVHCAGIEHSSLLAMTPPEKWNDVISVNLTGTYNCCKYAVKKMLPNKYGRIINISSASATMPFPGQAAYAASKAGVNALTKVLAKEMAKFGITVNAVSPGFVHSPMADEYYEKNVSSIPSGRFAEPEEIASLVCYLAGKDAGYITGAIYSIDGGLGA
jgi:3-oxoacyl-[acyl-carrier protein] reductase